MRILNITIAITILIGACIIGSVNTGGIGSLWDVISLAIILGPAYFLTASSANSYNFIKDKNSILLFGELCWGFGLIGTCVGFIFMCAGMTMPAPAGVDLLSTLAANFGIAIITILYGLLFKYAFALPLAHSIKES